MFFNFGKAPWDLLLRSYFGCYCDGCLLQYLSFSIQFICLTSKNPFKVTLCWLAAASEFPHRVSRACGSNSLNGKSVADFFHLYVHQQDFSIILHWLNRCKLEYSWNHAWISAQNFLDSILPLTSQVVVSTWASTFEYWSHTLNVKLLHSSARDILVYITKFFL